MFTEEKIDGNKMAEVPSSVANSEYKGFTYVTNSVSTELMDMKKTEESN